MKVWTLLCWDLFDQFKRNTLGKAVQAQTLAGVRYFTLITPLLTPGGV